MNPFLGGASFVLMPLLMAVAYTQIPTGIGSTVSAPDSTVTVGTQLYIQGALLAGFDSVRFDFYSNDSVKVTKRTPLLAFRTTLPAPAYGKSATYKGCAQVERGGRTSGVKLPAAPICWTWSYTRDIPTLAADSVVRLVLKPPVVNFSAAGESRFFCAFGVTVSGRRVKMANSWNRPECEAAYQSWLAEAPA
jgi:hypothetical protein